MLTTNLAAADLPTDQRQQAYNAMDACMTAGIHERLLTKLSADAALVYDFERAMQGPAFTMACRGIAVDEVAAGAEIDRLLWAEARTTHAFQRLAEVWTSKPATDVSEIRDRLLCGKPLRGTSPHSPLQVKNLLFAPLPDGCGEAAYKARTKRPANADGTRGEPSSTANEEALVMLQARSPVVGLLAHLILRARELRKLRGFVAARRSPDGRLRSSFNVGATTSGRWSFSKNCFGDGLNFGNIPKAARTFFVASCASRVLVNVDLRQAESYIVGQIADDHAYVAAHETGDAHGAIARDLFGHLAPPDADMHAWVRAPNAALPRGESPRQACKKLGHGTNYGIGARKSSKITGLPISAIEDFRRRFFAKYAGVETRIDGIEARLRANPRFTSVLGRPHHHLGAPWDPETHRAALADEPQGIVADVLNVALWRLWRWHDIGDAHPRLWLLAQNYDSILFECVRADLDAARAACARAFDIPLCAHGRAFVIPHEFGYGRTWKDACA